MNAACLGVLIIAALPLCAQTPGQPVTIDLFARDTHGKPVTDLRADEVRMIDAGHSNPIVHFRTPLSDDRFPYAIVCSSTSSTRGAR